MNGGGEGKEHAPLPPFLLYAFLSKGYMPKKVSLFVQTLRVCALNG